MASARSLVAMAMNIGLVFTVALALYSCVANGEHPVGRRGLAANPGGDSAVFDITQFGGKGDGSTNNFKAFLKAWIQVCASPIPAKLLIPKGTFVAGPVVFAGPCKSPVTVEVQGTIQATKGMTGYASSEWILFEYIDNFELVGPGTLDGQGASVWKADGCGETEKCKLAATSLKFRHLNNAVINNLHSINSKAFHMFLVKSNNITIHHVKLNAPGDSPNTDGIHLSNTDSVKILDSKIATGDDCVSIGRGSNNVNIERITCGPGHGISIGSLGKYKNEEDVSGIHVRNCTLIGTDNGARIKTWGGSSPSVATNITFEDIVMDKVQNPVIIDQEYGSRNGPSQVKISNVVFRNIRGTSVTKQALQFSCSTAVPCQGVQVEDVKLDYVGSPHGDDSDNDNDKNKGDNRPQPTPLISALCNHAKVIFGGNLNFPICQ